MSDSNEKENESAKKSIFEGVSKKTIALASCAATAILILVLEIAFPNIFTMPVKMGYLEDRVSKIETSISSIEENVRKIDKSLASMGVETGIALENIETDSAFAVPMNNVLNGRDLPAQASTVHFLADTVVGHRKGTGAPVTVGEILNCNVLLPYLSGAQEVFFYGQINDNGHWDGNCILNTYEDNKLVLITDATYDDGTLISSKQVFYYAMRSGQMVWAYADYSQENGISKGDTKLYVKENDCIKDFGIDDVTSEDILSADKFQENYCKKLHAYYCGSTSDGFFNDESGDSYIIYFSGDGYVNQLYCGNFKNGMFNDFTGNAWHIVRNEKTNYMYYKGNFRDGNESKSGKHETIPPPMTMQDIVNVIGDRTFNMELKWADLNGPMTM